MWVWVRLTKVSARGNGNGNGNGSTLVPMYLSEGVRCDRVLTRREWEEEERKERKERKERGYSVQLLSSRRAIALPLPLPLPLHFGATTVAPPQLNVLGAKLCVRVYRMYSSARIYTSISAIFIGYGILRSLDLTASGQGWLRLALPYELCICILY